MNKSKIYLFTNLITIFYLFLTTGCGLFPDSDTEPLTSPREMTWASENLKPHNDNNWGCKFWGKSADNLYMIEQIYQQEPNLWHFDGSEWNRIDLQLTNLHLNKIYGFSDKNILLLGTRADSRTTVMVHYDGENINITEIDKDVMEGSIDSIWGTGIDNIWIKGYRKLAYFDGNKWSKVNISEDGSEIPWSNLVGESPNNLYILTQTKNSPDINLCKFDGRNWEKNYLGKFNETHSNLMLVDGTLFSYWLSIAEFSFGVWKDFWFKNYSNVYYTCGINRNSIIAADLPDGIFHWNGSDWEKLNIPFLEPHNDHVKDIWSDGKEVFFVARTDNQIKIIRGK